MDTKNKVQGISEENGLSKREQVDFLTDKLNDTIRIYLENEVNYRSIQSKILSESKANDQMMNANNQARFTRDALQAKIRNFRFLIKEIEKGEFNV